MHWLVGIDEAGYGPNLGPLVQAAVGIEVNDPDECLWTKHAADVCRATDSANGRVVIDDSKLVHVGPNKLDKLQTNLRRLLPANTQLNDTLCCDSLNDLKGELWFVANQMRCLIGRAGSVSDRSKDSSVPPVADAPGLPILSIGMIRAAVTATPKFNRLVDLHGTKAAPLSHGVITLLRATTNSLPEHAITFVIDKQGGRNYYSPMLATAFPDGWVRVLGEAGECSRYEVEGLGRPARFTFRPKAERESMPVAIASMLAKYLRELLMQQFNRYWLEQVPGLEPTAGYPTDAKRFYAAIAPEMARLRLMPDQVWRKK